MQSTPAIMLSEASTPRSTSSETVFALEDNAELLEFATEFEIATNIYPTAMATFALASNEDQLIAPQVGVHSKACGERSEDALVDDHFPILLSKPQNDPVKVLEGLESDDQLVVAEARNSKAPPLKETSWGTSEFSPVSSSRNGEVPELQPTPSIGNADEDVSNAAVQTANSTTITCQIRSARALQDILNDSLTAGKTSGRSVVEVDPQTTVKQARANGQDVPTLEGGQSSDSRTLTPNVKDDQTRTAIVPFDQATTKNVLLGLVQGRTLAVEGYMSERRVPLHRVEQSSIGNIQAVNITETTSTLSATSESKVTQSSTVEGAQAFLETPNQPLPVEITSDVKTSQSSSSNGIGVMIGDPPRHNAGIFRSVVAQVLESIQARANGSIELSLKPDELGSIRITMSASDSGMNATISVDRAETLELLRRNAGLLSREFTSLGYSSVNLSFEQSDNPLRSGKNASHDGFPTEDDGELLQDVGITRESSRLSDLDNARALDKRI